MVLNEKLKRNGKYENSIKILEFEWTLRELTTKELNQRFPKLETSKPNLVHHKVSVTTFPLSAL